MMRLLLILVLLCVPVLRAWANFDPFVGPKPLLVFIETDPWLSVIGSDTPRVVVYENGNVIYAKQIEKQLVYYQAMLDKAEQNKLVDELKSFSTTRDLKPQYSLSNWTDLPTSRFYIRSGGRTTTTSVYGLRENDTIADEGTVSDRLPQAILSLHRWLQQVRFRNAKPW